MKSPNEPSQHKGFMGRESIFVCVLLSLATLCVFWPAIHCDFINYDDNIYVTANSHVKQGLTQPGLAWAFHTTTTGNWHPLTWLSLMANAQITGSNAAGFHLVNLLLHIINTLLLFLLLKRLTTELWQSAFVATLFALHPLHVESVAWIAERKDVLSAFFFMLTILAYARFAQNQSRRKVQATRIGKETQTVGSLFRVPDYWLALSFFALGLMSKPMLVTLPFVLLLLDFWPLHRFNLIRSARGLVAEKIPFFILSVMSCAVTFAVQKAGENIQTLATFSVGTRLENAAVSCARYIEKTFLPVNLAVPYPYPSHWPLIEVALAVTLVVVISWLSLQFARQYPFLTTGWFWFLGMLVPVVGLIQVGTQSMADRYTYLPLIGLLIVFAWGGDEIRKRFGLSKLVTGIFSGLVISACALLTIKQLGYWQNSETLFNHAVSVTQNNTVAYEHLGNYFVANKRFNQAADAYEKAIQINPAFIPAQFDLGSLYLLTGETDKAAGQFEKVLRLSPDSAEAYSNLGYICAAGGNNEKAIAYYDKAIQFKPDFATAYLNRGLVFASEGQWDEAVQNYRKALQFDPTHASTHRDLGNALAHQGIRVESIKEYHEALTLKPDDPAALQQLHELESNP